MSYTPATLTTLADLWRAHGGTFLGVVGSTTTHCGGYHLGKDRIYGTCACKPAGTCIPGRRDGDYSMTDNPGRDKAHATNAAMAIDLGPLAGRAGSEVAFAKWLIGQCQKGAPDTLDIRAVNYLTLRWDRQRGQTSAVYTHGVNETGHAHIEFYRDSEGRDKTAVVARYFASLPVVRKVACDGGHAWSGPSGQSERKEALPAGVAVTVVATVDGGPWSFDCGGVARSGTTWYKVTRIGAVSLAAPEYIAVGRF